MQLFISPCLSSRPKWRNLRFSSVRHSERALPGAGTTSNMRRCPIQASGLSGNLFSSIFNRFVISTAAPQARSGEICVSPSVRHPEGAAGESSHPAFHRLSSRPKWRVLRFLLPHPLTPPYNHLVCLDSPGRLCYPFFSGFFLPAVPHFAYEPNYRAVGRNPA